MTASNYLRLLLIGWFVLGNGARVSAADDEAAASTAGVSTAASTSAGKTTSHKTTHHRKKKSTTATTGATAERSSAMAGTGSEAGDAAMTGEKKTHAHTDTVTTTRRSDGISPAAVSGPITIDGTVVSGNPPVGLPAVTKPVETMHTPITISSEPPSAVTSGSPLGNPEVNTGLPIARRGTEGNDLPGSTRQGSTYQVASALPLPGLVPVTSYLSHPVRTPLDNFKFTNLTSHRNVYPWKINIFTTMFWIGESSTPVSSTTNVASAWDEEWSYHNGGTDTPGDSRRDYMPAHHAARLNPFYIALPFNDLAFPEKAREWLPAGWTKPPRDGKQVSACQHRWIQIKNAQGDVCYAQWEDVGPLNYSDAEYVFGGARPVGLGPLRAGLDVSPAVADYLNITGKNCMTRWRFVDDADVIPGKWLQDDEEAVLFRAMHELREDPTRTLPIDRARAPIDDDTDENSNKKRIGSAKG